MKKVYFRLKIAFLKIFSTIFLFVSSKDRVALDITNSRGRYLPYLYLALCEKFKIEVESDEDIIIFLRLLGLKGFVKNICARNLLNKKNKILITTKSTTDHSYKNIITINADYFKAVEENNNSIMPFYLHPETYYSGKYKDLDKMRNNKRQFKLFFAGTYDKESYTKDFKPEILNRHEVITILLENFKDKVLFVNKKSMVKDIENSSQPILLVTTDDTRNDYSKYIIDSNEYFDLMSKSEFCLAAPGCAQAQAHNLLEAMAVGTVPIFNYNEMFYPKLSNAKDSLHFETKEELVSIINKVLDMSDEEVSFMKQKAVEFYDKYQTVEAFSDVFVEISKQKNPTLYINNDVESVRLYWDK